MNSFQYGFFHELQKLAGLPNTADYLDDDGPSVTFRGKDLEDLKGYVQAFKRQDTPTSMNLPISSAITGATSAAINSMTVPTANIPETVAINAAMPFVLHGIGRLIARRNEKKREIEPENELSSADDILKALHYRKSGAPGDIKREGAEAAGYATWNALHTHALGVGDPLVVGATSLARSAADPILTRILHRINPPKDSSSAPNTTTTKLTTPNLGADMAKSIAALRPPAPRLSRA